MVAWRQLKLIALSSAMLAVCGGSVWAATFYVATNGDDSGSGTLAEPFRTLEQAQAAIRATGSASNGGTVYVRGGTYYRTSTFALSSADSGPSANAPVVYLAYTNETPVIVGGLPLTNFQTYSGSILAVNISTQGFGATIFRQLFFGDNRQRQARYPNYDSADPYGGGWSYVAGELSDMNSPQSGESYTRFNYGAGDVPHYWANPTNASVVIFPRYNWWNNIANVNSIDTNSRLVELKSRTSYTIRAGDRYYVQNIFEELDAPGEWYLNTNSILYFWPGPSIIAGSVVAPLITNIVTIGSGARNITFQGFTMNACEGTAISLTGTTNCLVAQNTIRNVGDYDGSGVQVTGGFNNGVVGNDISYVGRNGITISGGTTTTLTPAQNYADNNYIHHTGVFFKEGVGINLTGVGNRASHNYIHDAPRFGIYFQGQNLLVEYNQIRNVMLETDDGSIIYTESINWLGSRGSIVRYNYLHNADGWGFESGTRGVPCATFGVYLDDLTGGVDVIGNVVADTSGPGIFVNGGSYNRISNNIVYLCDHPAGAVLPGNQQIRFTGYKTNASHWINRIGQYTSGYDSVSGQSAWSGMRGMDVAPTNIVYGASGYTISSNFAFQNIFVYTNAAGSGLDWAYYLYGVDFDRNQFASNLVFHYGDAVEVATNYPTPWLTWQAMGQDVGSITNDPLIVSPAAGDFVLSEGSPAITALGFAQIPMSQIGLYDDPLRASWPVVEAPGAREGFKKPRPPSFLRPEY
jgi:parallel beta-helix repeat protein